MGHVLNMPINDNLDRERGKEGGEGESRALAIGQLSKLVNRYYHPAYSSRDMSVFRANIRSNFLTWSAKKKNIYLLFNAPLHGGFFKSSTRARENLFQRPARLAERLIRVPLIVRWIRATPIRVERGQEYVSRTRCQHISNGLRLRYKIIIFDANISNG